MGGDASAGKHGGISRSDPAAANGTLTLSTEEQVLAQATKRAIRAAGGLEVCEQETGISTSHLSRCASPNHRDSITIRDVALIEGIAHGQPGHPYILRALGRQLGFVVVAQPTAIGGPDSVMQSVMELTAELGDVAQSIGSALSDGEIKPAEAADALGQLDELDEASARLRLKLKALAT